MLLGGGPLRSEVYTDAMSFLLPASVFALMVSVGMSLSVRTLVANWRRPGWWWWLRLLIATFIVPPAIALLLYRLLPLDAAEGVGLFMVAVAPGAPLLTRNIAKRGFDMHLAASYQVWGACLTPLMIPLVVAAAGKLHNRDIWISPSLLAGQIVEKQFLPLLLGLALMHFAPGFSVKLGPTLNTVGNLVLTTVFIVALVKMGPALLSLTPWLPVAAIVLAIACIGAIRLILGANPVAARTLAISNANRHVGLALLLSGKYLHRRDALPAVACYAVVVAIAMFIYPKLVPKVEEGAAAA